MEKMTPEKEKEMMDSLNIEVTISKMKKNIEENKRDELKAKTDALNISGFLENVDRKLKIVQEWESNHESIEKSRQTEYDKLILELNKKFEHANILVTSLLGFIELGRVSQYRDLDRRFNNDDLLLLEYVVQQLKIERSI